MKRIFTFAACLFVSLLSATGAETRSAPAAVRDRMWSWAVDASFDWPAHEAGETPGKNRMTPVEGAVYLGVPNAMFIQYQGIQAAPFQQYYTPFKALQQVFWTLSSNGNQVHELGQEQEHVYKLAADNPNITGLLLDDFLIGPFGDNDDPHWLAANKAAFPVNVVTSLPEEVTADSLVPNDPMKKQIPIRNWQAGTLSITCVNVPGMKLTKGILVWSLDEPAGCRR